MFSQRLLDLMPLLFGVLEFGLLAAALILHLCKHHRLDEIDRIMAYGKFDVESYHDTMRDFKLAKRVINLLLISTGIALITMAGGACHGQVNLAILALFIFSISFAALGKNMQVKDREEETFRQYLENTPWIVKVGVGLMECPFKKTFDEQQARRALQTTL